MASAERQSPGAASGACLEMLDEMLSSSGLDLDQATAFAADLGPGSFIGTRVSVTLAKTLAFARGVETLGASSFDLIGRDATVALPSKKGEFFVKRAGELPVRTSEPPEEAIGYGQGVAEQRYPSAAGFAGLLSELPRLSPFELVPEYLIEPSISTPKKPYGLEGRVG
jgi:tRNA threonylcarbamoyladenosine biosynthesis protein TsaB